MNRFFSSDHHFFHDSVIGFTGRKFDGLTQMHEALIEAHNSVVKPGDQWYCLGDFSFSQDARATNDILKRMNGQKFLVKGNHDHYSRIKGVQSWAWTKDRHEIVVRDLDLPEFLVLDHFPHLSWHRMHYGAYMLHGHSHGNLRYPENFKTCRIFDVGVDNLMKVRGSYAPMEWAEVREHLKDRTNAALDHHITRDIPANYIVEH